MGIECLLKLKETGEISEDAYNQIRRELDDNTPIDTINKRLEGNKRANESQYKNIANENAIQKKNSNYVNHESNKTPEEHAERISELIVKPKGGVKASADNIASRTAELLGRYKVPLAKHYKELISRLGGWKEPKAMHDAIAHKINNPSSAASKEVTEAVKDMEQSLANVNEDMIKVGITPTVNSLDQLAGLNSKVQNMSFAEFKKVVQPLVRDDEPTLLEAWKNAREGEEVFSFHFKDNEAQLTYNKTIGGDHFSNLMAYIDKQGSKVSATQILGTNPEKQLEKLIKESPKEISLDDQKWLKYMLKEELGTAEQTMNPSKLAAGISNLKSFATGTLMGGAVLTVPMDIKNVIMTLSQAGIGTKSLETFMNTVRLLKNEGDIHSLQQLGLQIESVNTALNLTGRMNPHAGVSHLMNKFATSTLRLTGLSVLSDTMKLSTKMTYLYSLRDFKGSTFAGLRKANPKFHQKMVQYGINETDWNIIRKSMKDEDMMFEPLNVQDATGSKVFRLINEEAEFAVVTPGSRSSYTTSQGNVKGTVKGEAFRAVSQFKSTIVEEVYTSWYRMIQQDGMKNKVQYGAAMFALSAVLGSMVTELKEVSKGNTPLNPIKAPKKFLGKTIEYQSFIPFVSDAIAAQIDPRYGQPSVWTAPLNPAAYGLPGQILEKTNKLIMAAGEAKTEKAKNDLWRTVSRIAPNYFFATAAYNEYFVHSISSIMAPNAERTRVHKMDARLKKDGQERILKMFE